VFSKSSDVPRLSFKLPDCMTAEKIEDCLISQGPPVNFVLFTVYSHTGTFVIEVYYRFHALLSSRFLSSFILVIINML